MVYHSYDGPGNIDLKPDNDNYRAALYSTQNDFSKAQQIVPEIQYSSTDSYIYLIQYGKDTVYEILGYKINSFKGCIKKLVYSKREATFTCIIDQTRTYHQTKDSITYSIDEKKGSVTDLCEGLELNSICDSVTFILDDLKTGYTIIFRDTIANLRSNYLFYPDVQYLPYKIIRMDKHQSTLTLETVIYGKSSIDSLIQLYDYDRYKQITNEDIGPMDRQFELDLIERLKAKE